MMPRSPWFLLGRRWRRILPLVLILTFLTPVAHWLSKEEDDIFDDEPSKSQARYKLPDFHRSLLEGDELTDQKPMGEHVVNKVVEHRPVIPEEARTPQPYKSMLVQLGDFPLKDELITVVGQKRESKAYVTIGIPTVLRNVSGSKYLVTTIKSLLTNMEPEELVDVIILIFLADTDKGKSQLILRNLREAFPKELDSGLFQVLSINQSAYPPLTGLKRNYGDPEERVQWRAKQVVDFAFMFYYSRNLSHYYLQLEDDVMSSPYFLGRIKSFVAYQQGHWVALDFSMLGFIGKFLRSSDLEEFARFMLMFYDEQPADYLYSLYCKVLVQDRRILHKPTLFQHFGEHSSLGGKTQLTRDRYFALGKDAKVPAFTYEVNSTSNPPAFIITSIESYAQFNPDTPYGDSAGYFWGKEPRDNDIYLIVFKTNVQLRRVYIETGRADQQNDYLRSGVVEISEEKNKTKTDEKNNRDFINGESYGSPEVKEITDEYCSTFKAIGDFKDGQLDVKNLKQSHYQDTKCLRIRVTEKQEEWLIINNIVIETYPNKNQR